MKMLVGVPVFRVPDLVRSCLTALSDSPADILVVDNAADTDVKQVYNTFKNIHVSFSSTNEYCNGGWNRIFQFGLAHDYDLIAIGSSDAALHPGWYEAIQARAAQVSNEVWVPSIGEPVFNPDPSSVTYVDEWCSWLLYLLAARSGETCLSHTAPDSPLVRGSVHVRNTQAARMESGSTEPGESTPPAVGHHSSYSRSV
jgi:hypothetical protein